MIRAYYADVSAVGEHVALFDRVREEKIRRLRTAEARQRSIGAGALLVEVLKSVGIERPRIGYTAYGKPYLLGQDQIHYNLSHSGVYAACVISDSPCGVDIQHVDRMRERIAARYYSLSEREYVEGSADTAYAFTKIWTMRESYGKAMGKGLCESMDAYETDPVRMEYQGWRWSEAMIKDYVLMICGRESCEEIRELDIRRKGNERSAGSHWL